MLNVAIVGLGYWGPNLLRNFYGIKDVCKVQYACDLSEKNINKFKGQYPDVQFVQDFEEMLKDETLDAVVIATPVETHYKLGKMALEAGKHLLLEKPMCSNSEECQELINLAKEKNLILMVDHIFLYTSVIRKMKELVDDGTMGDLYYFDSERINVSLVRSDVSVIWDLAPHDISIMYYLFEGKKPKSIYVIGNQRKGQKVTEMAYISVEFEDGTIGHIHVSWLSSVKIRQTLLGGSKKMLKFDQLDMVEQLKIYDRGHLPTQDEVTVFQPAYMAGDIHVPRLNNVEALKVEALHFLACIRGEEQPMVTGEDGRDVVRVLQACDESLKLGQKIYLNTLTPFSEDRKGEISKTTTHEQSKVS